MTLSEFTKELEKLDKEGYGEYKVTCKSRYGDEIFVNGLEIFFKNKIIHIK